MFTQMHGERITHMADDSYPTVHGGFNELTVHNPRDGSREHELTSDCWCGPTVERFNAKTKQWEEV